jgi:hypothetical protein
MVSHIISRRLLAAGFVAMPAASLISTLLPRGALSASDLTIPYIKNIVALPGNFADCTQLAKLISQAKDIRNQLKSENFVDAMIADQVRVRDALDKEIAATKQKIDSMDKSVVVQKVAVFLGLGFLAAGLVVTSPLAIGALLGLQVLSGTTILGLQAIYSKPTAPSLVVGYTKDRALLFGEAIADQAGSTGGKIVTKSLSLVALAVDIYSLGADANSLDQLRNKLMSMTSEAEALKALLTKFAPSNRGPWRAIFDTNLQGTISQLQYVIDNYSATNCIVIQPIGPILKQP